MLLSVEGPLLGSGEHNRRCRTHIVSSLIDFEYVVSLCSVCVSALILGRSNIGEISKFFSYLDKPEFWVWT
jgi:hypothetical protein